MQFFSILRLRFFIVSLFCFISQRKTILSALLSLERIILACLFQILNIPESAPILTVFVLIIAACERALGLTILVRVSRAEETDKLFFLKCYFFSIKLYNYFPNNKWDSQKILMIFLSKNNLFFLSFFVITFILLSVDLFRGIRYLFIFNFYLFNRVRISFPILLDFYRVLFRMTVLFIRGNIIKFASFYINDEKFKTRFLLILLIFIFSILFLIFVPNLFFLIIGWDGLGISSFYLIMFYHNQKSLGARLLTLLSNRIGDLCLLLSIALFFSLGVVFSSILFPLRILLLIGCFTKRAQFPFIRWLPAAIAAPTPVSALVHSSTLVTAGVYLIIRFFNIIIRNSLIVFATALISSLTMLISALRAMFETDFKKIIALSTLRQLGFIIFSLSQIIKICRFFHLLTHAVFKSLLFICAGAIIIFSGHNQDIRALPKSYKSVVQRSFIIARIALMRTPFLVGFYSKDLILEIFFQNQTKNWSLVMVVFLSSWLTVAYSIRIIYLRLWHSPNVKLVPIFDIKEVFLLNKAVSFSSLGSIIGGRILSWLFFFEAKTYIPLVSSREIYFICSFILIGRITFWGLLNSKPIKSLFYILYLTPIFQSFSAPTFRFSKNLYHFSDKGWLENITYSEFYNNSIKLSILFYKLIKEKPLIKHLIALIIFLIIIKCF